VAYIEAIVYTFALKATCISEHNMVIVPENIEVFEVIQPCSAPHFIVSLPLNIKLHEGYAPSKREWWQEFSFRFNIPLEGNIRGKCTATLFAFEDDEVSGRSAQIRRVWYKVTIAVVDAILEID